MRVYAESPSKSSMISLKSYWQMRDDETGYRDREGHVEWWLKRFSLDVGASHHLLDEFFIFDVAIEILLCARVFQDLIDVCVG